MKKPSQTLKNRIKICKICFKPIDFKGFFNVINKNSCLCSSCLKTFKPCFKKFKIDDINCLSLFNYDEQIRKLLYMTKGCGDIEMADVFLNPYYSFLKYSYFNYIAVPAPSNKKDDENRGFNHVQEIFKCLGLKMSKCIYKTKDFKQADLGLKDRQEAHKKIGYKNDINLKGKNVLLVDDVVTSGSTMKAMIGLIKKQHPRKIRALVIARTETIFD